MTDTPVEYDEHDAAELAAFRAGAFQLAYDQPMSGHPVIEVERQHDEPVYYLQRVYDGRNVHVCHNCTRVSLGTPVGCQNCGADRDEQVPLLTEHRFTCRSWPVTHDGGYDGDCLIAGSDGCDCPDVNA